MLTDHEIALFNQRNPAVITALYTTLYPVIHNYSRSVLRNKADADDAAQDAFTRVWTGKGSYKNVTELNKHLFAVARNICVDIYRRKQLHRKLVMGLMQEEGYEHPDFLHSQVEAEVIHKLKTAISELDTDERRVIELYFLEGEDNESISQLLDISIRTVIRWKLSALEKLRQTLGNCLFIFLFIIQVLVLYTFARKKIF